MNTEEIARILDDAAIKARPIEQISLKQEFNEQQAYEIQMTSIQRRLSRGEKFVGIKLGFTSKAKMEQMGVHDLIWGQLTSSMLYENGSDFPIGKYIHPRAEPEICFLIKKPIDRSITLTEAPDYVEAVAPALEIIDSRYANFKFSLEDVIADNCSSAGLVIGKWQSPDTDISDLAITLSINGQVVQSGSSAAILGNPWESVVAAARLATDSGLIIPEGAVLMAGAATPAQFLNKQSIVSARVALLGDVKINIV